MGYLLFHYPSINQSIKPSTILIIDSTPLTSLCFQNGWYHLIPEAAVKPGQVVQVEALGTKFAVWRSKKQKKKEDGSSSSSSGGGGEIGVFDAFCPHGGANLSCGEVVGDALRCPFHFWTFAVDGTVRDVPWLDAPPSKNQIVRRRS